jgi:hypothetical protein
VVRLRLPARAARQKVKQFVSEYPTPGRRGGGANDDVSILHDCRSLLRHRCVAKLAERRGRFQKPETRTEGTCSPFVRDFSMNPNNGSRTTVGPRLLYAFSSLQVREKGQ